jgi:hypothetical protein
MDELNNFDPIEARRAEVAQYDQNIIIYKKILEDLPTEWPERLLEHRNASNQHEEIDRVEDLEDVELLSKLWYADNIHRLIRSEIVERTKSAAILAALESQANNQ